MRLKPRQRIGHRAPAGLNCADWSRIASLPGTGANLGMPYKALWSQPRRGIHPTLAKPGLGHPVCKEGRSCGLQRNFFDFGLVEGSLGLAIFAHAGRF
jgi:hypothetical protein